MLHRLSTSYLSPHVISQQSFKSATIVTPILQMTKLRLKRVWSICLQNVNTVIHIGTWKRVLQQAPHSRLLCGDWTCSSSHIGLEIQRLTKESILGGCLTLKPTTWTPLSFISLPQSALCQFQGNRGHDPSPSLAEFNKDAFNPVKVFRLAKLQNRSWGS